MKLSSVASIDLPPVADFHCHLRQDGMMEFCTPFIERGGCDTVYVMPNLQPPIRYASDALLYHKKLSKLAPNVKFMMTLFLHPGLDERSIAEAAQSEHIYGVKLYPAGVTTNSKDGVSDIKQFYPIFKVMEKYNLVLNIHGEKVGSAPADAEADFLPELFELAEKFPNLRIVCEHISTKAGLEAVQQCGSNVRATITAHHLLMTSEDATRDVFNFCKPIAKTLEDRIALVQAVVDGSSKFFFGSDSAPHPVQSKRESKNVAGCFTQGWAAGLVISALEQAMNRRWISEEDVTSEKLKGFLSYYGREFYRVSEATGSGQPKRHVVLRRTGEKIPEEVKSADGTIQIVPFGRGKEIMSVTWGH